MTAIELIAESLNTNVGFLKATLADFSDADMLVRPVPGANHAMWQVGHLVVSHSGILAKISGRPAPEAPAGFLQKFAKETATIDDPAAFPKKDEVLNQLGKVMSAAADYIRTLTEADLNKPSPVMQQVCPTVGSVILLLANHLNMHMGQMQVIRRKLGKPVLF